MSEPRPRPQIMSLTDRAAERVREMLASRPGVIALRIGLKNGGCAGMEYTMGWAESQDKFDEVVEDKGVKVFIEPGAVMYLLGTKMDFEVDKLSSGFVFDNPNQQGACGCGESVELAPAARADIVSDAN